MKALKINFVVSHFADNNSSLTAYVWNGPKLLASQIIAAGPAVVVDTLTDLNIRNHTVYARALMPGVNVDATPIIEDSRT